MSEDKNMNSIESSANEFGLEVANEVTDIATKESVNNSDSRKNGFVIFLRKNIKIVVALAVVLLLLLTTFLTTWIITKKYYKNHSETEIIEKEVPIEIPVEVPVEIEVKKTITSDMIKSSLRDISELATAEFTYTQVEKFESKKTINESFTIPFSKSTMIFSYDGIIKYGIDISEIEVEKDDEKQMVVVTIPHSKILSSELDLNSFELYDEKEGLFNSISAADVNASQVELKQKAEEKALARGILEEADKNAKKLIEDFLKNAFDLEEYKITVNFKE